MKKLILVFVAIAINFAITSCGGNTSTEVKETTAYEKMTVVFDGQPAISEIKAILEPVMIKHKLPVTEENLSKAASMLVSARERSNIKEMDLLRHMYKNGSDKLSFTEQAGISLVMLQSGQ